MASTEDIYELADPRDGKIHYVGRSVDGRKRWKSHQSGLLSSSNQKMVAWLIELKRNKLKPVFIHVNNVKSEDAAMAEREHIEKRLREGCELFNIQFNPSNPAKLPNYDHEVYKGDFHISCKKTIVDPVERAIRLKRVYSIFDGSK